MWKQELNSVIKIKDVSMVITDTDTNMEAVSVANENAGKESNYNSWELSSDF